MPSSTSRRLEVRTTSSTASTFDATLSCESITPFGRPVEPGGEDDRQQVVTAKGVQTQPANQQRTGHDVALQATKQLVGQRDLLAQILEQDEFGIQLKFKLLHHFAAG